MRDDEQLSVNDPYDVVERLVRRWGMPAIVRYLARAQLNDAEHGTEAGKYYLYAEIWSLHGTILQDLADTFERGLAAREKRLLQEYQRTQDEEAETEAENKEVEEP